MKRFGIKTVTWYAIIGLLVAVALLPILKASAPQYFPYAQFEGFRELDCVGMTCGEGEFCKENKCNKVATNYRDSVPEGNE
jgi:hypothetical protein